LNGVGRRNIRKVAASVSGLRKGKGQIRNLEGIYLRGNKQFEKKRKERGGPRVPEEDSKNDEKNSPGSKVRDEKKKKESRSRRRLDDRKGGGRHSLHL